MVCSVVALLPRIDYTAYHFLGALLLHQATVHSTSSDYVTVSKWVFFILSLHLPPDFPNLPFLPGLLLSFAGKCSVLLLKQRLSPPLASVLVFSSAWVTTAWQQDIPGPPLLLLHVVSLAVANVFVLSIYGKLNPGFFLFWHVATVLDAFVSRYVAAMV